MKKIFAAITVLVACTGCAEIVHTMYQSTIDNTFATEEEREVRIDRTRMLEGKPLKYHRNVEHLKRHREKLRDRKWEERRRTREERQKKAQ